MYDVQKNISSIAKSNISKAQCRYKSDYDKKHCKGKVKRFNMYLCICMLSCIHVLMYSSVFVVCVH